MIARSRISSLFLPLPRVCRAFWRRDYANETEANVSSTIFALSSGQGKSGIAVVRVSGPGSAQALLRFTLSNSLPKARKAVLKKFVDPQSGSIIDHGIALWFPGPRSFTGEDSVEFHVHGGPSVVLAMLNALSRLCGFQHAEPGEFTKRAFFNGKLDLTEVEGLADLIHAETEAQRKQALRQFEGDLSKLYHKWSKTLLTCVAHVEAIIDFGEEENVEEGLYPEVKENIKVLIDQIQQHLEDGRRGERLRTGIHIAIIGAPNAGKSSLLNILCQRPAAIVSPYAGTTRDVIESTLDIFGYPVVLCDTAGLRDIDDPVEREGVRRAVQRAEMADLKLLITDSSSIQDHLHDVLRTAPFSKVAEMLLQSQSSHTNGDWMRSVISSTDTLVIMNKTDLWRETQSLPRVSAVGGVPVCWLSCKTQDGMSQFMSKLKGQLVKLAGDPLAGNPSLTQARHRHHLVECLSSLHDFMEQSGEDSELVMAAQELRIALRHISRITGKIWVDDILDIIFRDFCIGK